MDNVFEKRVKQLKASFPENGIDTFMVLVEENRRYLSGFEGEDTQFDESAGALFINDSRCILATDSRFAVQAKHEAPLYEVVCYKEGLSKQLPDILTSLKTRRLGFESRRVSYLQHRKFTEEVASASLPVEFADFEDVVENFRVLKQEPEIEAIRAALSIAESVFKEYVRVILPGMTEKEVAWELEKRLRESGADALSFPTIVASGPNSALPHAIPGDRKLCRGEPILFDWGVKRNGYCSDISRTVIIGEPDETFRKVFSTVLDAQRKAIEAIKPGISTKAVDGIARKHVESMGFKDNFGHGLGHGVGLAIHEPPRLSPLSEKPLEPNMLFTVEPGIYIPEWGGVRLENMAVVREEGVEILNRTDPGLFRAGE